MSKRLSLLSITGLLAVAAAAMAATVMLQAKPFVFDPHGTHLVQSGWLSGIGCPTNAKQFVYGPPPDYPVVQGPNYQDPACPTGDPRDQANEGLLLVKTGPTANVASAGVVLTGWKSPITELGYDLRKPNATVDPRGSHCGAGAPRFNITTKDGTTYFIGCNSPPPTTQTSNGSDGWIRLRWGGAVPLLAYGPSGLTDVSALDVKKLSIVFDEGQDTAPDNFGLAVLDNVDVNGDLAGQGAPPSDRNGNGNDNGGKDNGGNDNND
jgi:hypothetical protein